MKKESLENLREIIIMILSEYDYEEIIPFIESIRKTNKVDKGELMINSYHFFAPEKYDRNIKVLKKNDNVWKTLYKEK